MRLDRRIVLVEPGPRTRGPDGTPHVTVTRHTRHAGRKTATGADLTPADTAIHRSRVTYTLRYEGLSRLTPDWWIEDDGLEYRIESVRESPVGRRQFVLIDAVART